ncbi:MAG: hypothetical protein U1E81_20230 [Xanthobacteraceae bacterium]
MIALVLSQGVTLHLGGRRSFGLGIRSEVGRLHDVSSGRDRVGIASALCGDLLSKGGLLIEMRTASGGITGGVGGLL